MLPRCTTPLSARDQVLFWIVEQWFGGSVRLTRNDSKRTSRLYIFRPRDKAFLAKFAPLLLPRPNREARIAEVTLAMDNSRPFAFVSKVNFFSNFHCE